MCEKYLGMYSLYSKMKVSEYFTGVLKTIFPVPVSYCDIQHYADDCWIVVEPDLCDIERGLRY